MANVTRNAPPAQIEVNAATGVLLEFKQANGDACPEGSINYVTVSPAAGVTTGWVYIETGPALVGGAALGTGYHSVNLANGPTSVELRGHRTAVAHGDGTFDAQIEAR